MDFSSQEYEAMVDIVLDSILQLTFQARLSVEFCLIFRKKILENSYDKGNKAFLHSSYMLCEAFSSYT